MLDREGQFLDLQVVMYAHETVDIDVQDVSGQLGVEPGAQEPQCRSIHEGPLPARLGGDFPAHPLPARP